MRSLLLTGETVSDTWLYSLDLARGLSGLGVSVSLAVLGPPPSATQLAEARIAGLELVPTGLPTEAAMPDAEALRTAGAELAGLAHRLRVDGVHLHTPALAAEVAWTVPVVAAVHDDVGTRWQALHGGRLPPDLAWRAGATGRGLAEADAIIVPTHASALALDRCYRPGGSIRVVPHGLWPRRTPTPPRRPGVLAVGALDDPAANIGLLDRVAAELPAPMAVAGPAGGGARCVALRCLGVLPATVLAAEMAAATVFVSAARHAPSGLATLAAAQAGMALALSDLHEHRELWGDAALFFHPEDEGGARDAVRRLLMRPDSFAARAAERAARYSAEAMAAATLAVHRGLRQPAPAALRRSA